MRVRGCKENTSGSGGGGGCGGGGGDGGNTKTKHSKRFMRVSV